MAFDVNVISQVNLEGQPDVTILTYDAVTKVPMTGPRPTPKKPPNTEHGSSHKPKP